MKKELLVLWALNKGYWISFLNNIAFHIISSIIQSCLLFLSPVHFLPVSLRCFHGPSMSYVFIITLGEEFLLIVLTPVSLTCGQLKFHTFTCIVLTYQDIASLFVQKNGIRGPGDRLQVRKVVNNPNYLSLIAESYNVKGENQF